MRDGMPKAPGVATYQSGTIQKILLYRSAFGRTNDKTGELDHGIE
jgi:hypothetical protein